MSATEITRTLWCTFKVRAVMKCVHAVSQEHHCYYYRNMFLQWYTGMLGFILVWNAFKFTETFRLHDGSMLMSVMFIDNDTGQL